MSISDWSSDVCSSDLTIIAGALLPVWKALGAATYRNAVYRLQTDDGHQIVGRPLSAQVIPHFCSMLGTTAAPTDSVIAEIVSHLKNGAQVALTTATKTPHMLSGTFPGDRKSTSLNTSH